MDLIFSESRFKCRKWGGEDKQVQGKEERTKRTPRIRCWPALCLDEIDTDSEDIENEED